MKQNTIINIISAFFIVLFLYTGIMKTIDNHFFFLVMSASPPLHWIAPVLRVAVPLIELAVAVILIIGLIRTSSRVTKAGLYGALALMSVFTVYVAIMLVFKTHRPCSCGGIIKYMNWHQHFYFNTCATLLAALALWLKKRQYSSEVKERHTIIYT